MVLKKNAEGISGGFFIGFASWSHLARFCVSILFIAVILTIIVFVIFNVLPIGSKVKFSFNEMGSTEIYVGDQLQSAVVLVPSSQLWVDTGITVSPGQKLRITASGQINLGVHRLVQAAIDDVKPKLPWIGPSGGDYREGSPIYVRRKQLLVEPNAPLGCLLGYVRPQGEPDPTKSYPRPDGIFQVGKNVDYVYNDPRGRKGKLFLVINDNVLINDEISHESYTASQKELDENYGPGKYKAEDLDHTWNRLVSDQYWDIWYDDNIGQFLVQLTFE